MTKYLHTEPRKIFYALLLIFTIFNILTMGKYGLTWDEPAQQYIGSTYKNFLKNKIDKIIFPRKDLAYYGPFFEIVNQYSAAILQKINIDAVTSFHFLILVSSIFGLIFFFKLVSKIFNQEIALYSSSFLMFLPRFVAHSQYNSKDIPLFLFSFALFYFLYKTFIENDKYSWIFASFFLGAGFSIRPDIILAIPIFFIPYTIKNILDKKLFLKIDFIKITKIFVLSIFVVFICWPLTAQNPKLIYKALSYFQNHSWNNNVLYLGNEYLAKDLPWHYSLIYILATLPLILIFFSINGILKIKKDFTKKEIFSYIFLFLLVTTRIFFSFLPNASRYDGIRHFLPLSIPGIAILAGIGFYYALEKIKKIKIIFIATIYLILIFEFIKIFPYGDSYFNEITRIIIPKNIENYFEIEYWGSSYKEGVSWLNKNTNLNSSVCVPIADHLIRNLREDITMNCSKESNYLMFITRKTFIPKDLESFFSFKEKEPIFKISRLNSDLLYIYSIK